MNIPWTLRTAAFFGRARAYRSLAAYTVSLRHDPAAHRKACRTILQRWSLNWENGSRSSIIRDYEFLATILTEYQSHHAVNTQQLDQARTLVRNLIDITWNDENFRRDGRMMHTAPALETARLRTELSTLLRTVPW